MYSIYKITNNINDKVYIGSTKNIEVRKKRHLNDLKNNKHHSIYLQRFYNKHVDSIELFFHEILCNLTKEEVLVKEKELILEYYEVSFNMSKQSSGGDLISYHPNKKEIISKMVSTFKEKREKGLIKKPDMAGNKNPNYKNGDFTPVISVCPNCEKQKRTQKRFEGNLCLSCSASLRVGDKASFFGKHFSEESKKKLSESIKETNRKNRELGIVPFGSKRVYANGTLYSTMNDAAKALNVDRKTINFRVESKNWRYRSFYLEGSPKKIEDLKILKIDCPCIVDGINYSSVSQAIEKLQIPMSTFLYRCESTEQHFCNYEFKRPTTIENIYQI